MNKDARIIMLEEKVDQLLEERSQLISQVASLWKFVEYTAFDLHSWEHFQRAESIALKLWQKMDVGKELLTELKELRQFNKDILKLVTHRSEN